MKFIAAQTTALKLPTEANRLFWALSQYQAGLLPSAAMVANVPNGVPATAASVGPSATIAAKYLKPALVLPFTLEEQATGYEYSIQLLINGAVYARGLALAKSLQESSLYTPTVFAGTIPSELPALTETSTATTLEQYILEQHLAQTAARASLVEPFALLAQKLEIIDGSSDNGQFYLALLLEGAIKKTVENSGALQYRRNPYDVETFIVSGGGYGNQQ
jgi:hypothetical protein